MSANRNQRTVKPTFRRDWMAECVRQESGASWHAFLAEQYRNERVRKGFNDAAEASR